VVPILAVPASVGAVSATVPQPRLVRAAHEFEAQMMKELLKPMTGQDSLTGEDDDGGTGAGLDSGSGGALGEFASEALGQALSRQGGFGMANKIIKDLSAANKHEGKNENQNVTGKVTGR
jgi:Rod binding domain-containing protein